MSRKEEAYTYLKEQILSGKLLPETPISELQVSKTLEISRTPIREAIRDLESEGLLVTYPSRGAFVASISPYDMEEIYELRILLETWALEKSIGRITDQELASMEEEFQTAHKADDWQTLHEADRDLHRLITERAGSRRLMAFLDTLNAQIERIRRISSKEPERSERSFEEHMEIIRCIRSRDLEKSKDALKRHLRSVADSAIATARIGYYPG